MLKTGNNAMQVQLVNGLITSTISTIFSRYVIILKISTNICSLEEFVVKVTHASRNRYSIAVQTASRAR